MGRGGAVVGGLSPLKKDEETKREKEPRGAVPESRGPGGGPGRPGRHRPTAAGGDDAFDVAVRLGRRRALARRVAVLNAYGSARSEGRVPSSRSRTETTHASGVCPDLGTFTHLDHAGAVIAHEGGNLAFVSHVEGLRRAVRGVWSAVSEGAGRRRRGGKERHAGCFLREA